MFSRDPEEEFDFIYKKGEPAPDPTCYVCAPARTEPGVTQRCLATAVLTFRPDNLSRPIIIAVILMLFRCGRDDDCNDQLQRYGQASQEYQSCLANNRSSGRTGGSSYGGFSSGGSHK